MSYSSAIDPPLMNTCRRIPHLPSESKRRASRPGGSSLGLTSRLSSLADGQQYEYGEDLGVTAVALYDYQAGEAESCDTEFIHEIKVKLQLLAQRNFMHRFHIVELLQRNLCCWLLQTLKGCTDL